MCMCDCERVCMSVYVLTRACADHRILINFLDFFFFFICTQTIFSLLGYLDDGYLLPL